MKGNDFIPVGFGALNDLRHQKVMQCSARLRCWKKIMSTYFVPYVVSTYGAVSYRLSRPPQ